VKKIGASLFAASILALTPVSSARADTPAEEDCACGPQVEEVTVSGGEDNWLDRYLEPRGERLEEELGNVMKPMQQGEGVRGTTEPNVQKKPAEKK
jgi:hypothetical protein